MKNLRKIMRDKDLTAKELSAATGIRATSIFKYRTDERSPSLKNAQKIARALDVPLDELITKDDNDCLV